MREKAEYKSAVRSRKMIRQAFVELMQEKDVEKITVTDIVTRADINRGTFYAHYKDTHAVLEQIENEITEKMLYFLKEFNYNNFFKTPLPLLLKVARYLEENFEYYHILISAKGSEQFIEKLKNIYMEYMVNDKNIPASVRNTPEFIILTNFFAGGIVNLYRTWFLGEIDQPLDEISTVLSEFIISSTAALLEK